MTGDPLHVPAGEAEVVRVFALDLPEDQAERLADQPASNGRPSPLAELAGVPFLDRAHVEVFPVSDLRGVGLAGYLVDGLGIDDAEVEPARIGLEAETGYIVILHSRAFGGGDVTLAPKMGLRWLGTYHMAQADPAGQMPRVASAERPEPTEPEQETTPPVGRLPRVAMLLILLAAGVLVLLLAFLFGSSRG
ncbi:hypothetical protein [Psychromarinibacter sp. S121]|uniref:hypothetical protein n=1 Tax=Psychromarinibacter sp. S121 TaxID=3415127 RepID=UPI003C7DD3C8